MTKRLPTSSELSGLDGNRIPSVRKRAVEAVMVAVVITAGVVATVGWFEADREVRVLCSLMVPGTPLDEVGRVLGTAEMLKVRRAGVESASAFTFDAAGNLRSTRCAVSLDQAGVAGSTFTRSVRLERVAALAAGSLLLLLCGFQIGLATGAVSGRMAWGGRFETLPPSYRRASAVAALLVVVMAWVLLERAAVVDVVGGDGVIWIAAWAMTLLFLLSTIGNLASSSPAERRLGVPVATALVILSCIVAYSG